MQKAKYTAEFKEEAVRQVIERGHSVINEANLLERSARYSELMPASTIGVLRWEASVAAVFREYLLDLRVLYLKSQPSELNENAKQYL